MADEVSSPAIQKTLTGGRYENALDAQQLVQPVALGCGDAANAALGLGVARVRSVDLLGGLCFGKVLVMTLEDKAELIAIELEHELRRVFGKLPDNHREVDCSGCNGTGSVTYGPDHEFVKADLSEPGTYQCSYCGGSGRLVEETRGIDPFTIGIILTILIELIKLYMACNSEAGAVKSLASPSWWQRLLMRRTIRRKIRETKLRGLNEEIEVAFLKSGKETTVSEMEGFYTEVREL